MKQDNFLFVGGPKDGETVTLEERSQFIGFPQNPEAGNVGWLQWSGDRDLISRRGLDVYQLFILKSDPEEPRFYLHDSLNPSEELAGVVAEMMNSQ